jgi:rod shape-determining protein MreC
MRSLLRYLLKNYAFLLFVLLEAISLTMVINYNSFRKAKYLNSANWVAGNVYSAVASVRSYFHLLRINKELAEENVKLRSLLHNNPDVLISSDSLFTTSAMYDSVFRYTSAQVINNSTNRPFNYITLNKGRKHGIKPDQGIISANGIVGIVTEVSDSYAVGFSVLNSRWSVSAKHKESGYFGSLVWAGNDYRLAKLNEIPFHIDIERGDTVVTSGYSSVFPEGIIIGTIKDFSRTGGENYYSVDIALSTDFKKLSYVEVIENFNKTEIRELEKRTEDGP